MRRILTVAMLALAVGLGGCAQLQNAFQAATADYNNPVTPRMMYDLENGMIVAVSGLQAYKQACINRTIPPACRTVIGKLQIYTKAAKPLLVRLRVFIKTNDKVNAVVLYNEVSALLTGFKQTALAEGVN